MFIKTRNLLKNEINEIIKLESKTKHVCVHVHVHVHIVVDDKTVVQLNV